MLPNLFMKRHTEVCLQFSTFGLYYLIESGVPGVTTSNTTTVVENMLGEIVHYISLSYQ